MPDDAPNVTRLLRAWRGGDPHAFDALMPLVYDELRAVAARLMRGERRDHTLQATALVNEAYVRLAGVGGAATDRLHFFNLAARVMRRLLVDHARTRRRVKRGRGESKVTLAEVEALSPGTPERMIDLDEALSRLEALDARKSRVVELRVFTGLSNAEIATLLHVSVPTVERDFRMARAWLRTELGTN